MRQRCVLTKWLPFPVSSAAVQRQYKIKRSTKQTPGLNMFNNKKSIDKRSREDAATAIAFQEFIDTFQNDKPAAKLFIKSGTYNAGKSGEVGSDKGTIYNSTPMTKFNAYNTNKKAIECAKLLKDSSYEKSKNGCKPKSNLEILKEELRLRHLERDKVKVNKTDCSYNLESSDDTTNLFLTNLNPELNEQDLMQIFGVYGPLASVKIMWPRNDYPARNTNIGFVAFMSRKDSERAYSSLINSKDMRISWGKPIDIPSHPIFIPTELVKLMLPPPYSGLPLNAQPPNINYTYPKNQDEMDNLLLKSTVKVTLPLDKKVLCTIHRVIEFIIRDGPQFETIIMQKEVANPIFQFLFDTKSPNHVYYRWKLFSILNGESTNKWSSKPFKMFKNGPIWIPPIVLDYTKGMSNPKPIKKVESASLSDNQQYRLIQIIQKLTRDRSKIAEAMVFVVKHANANKDAIEIVAESFNNIDTNPEKKIARLYLLSDILYNVKNTSFSMIQLIETHLVEIFEQLGLTMKNITQPHTKTDFKIRVLKVLRAWELWKVYSRDFFDKLESKFLDQNFEDQANDGPLDGKLLLTRSLTFNPTYLITSPAEKQVSPISPQQKVKKADEDYILSNFLKSKWETLDPAQVETQAMSTKKLHDLEMARIENEKNRKTKPSLDYEVLRKIEIKVMEFQDQFERERKIPLNGKSIEEEVNEYRKRCIRKQQEKYKRHNKFINTSPISSDSLSSDEDIYYQKRKKRKAYHKSSFLRR